MTDPIEEMVAAIRAVFDDEINDPELGYNHEMAGKCGDAVRTSLEAAEAQGWVLAPMEDVKYTPEQQKSRNTFFSALLNRLTKGHDAG